MSRGLFLHLYLTLYIITLEPLILAKYIVKRDILSGKQIFSTSQSLLYSVHFSYSTKCVHSQHMYTVYKINFYRSVRTKMGASETDDLAESSVPSFLYDVV